MTDIQTRQLGIEFERRVQTMIPEKEYTEKLDTDTIYAYLNSYQDKYIHDIYRNLDQIKSGSKLSAHVESVLQQMLKTQTISIDQAQDYTKDIEDTNGIVIMENGRSVNYPLDPKFYMYVRSVSNVSSTYAFKSHETENKGELPIRVIPNELVSQSDVWRLLETPHNSLRILRYPAATIGEYKEYTFEPALYYATGTGFYPGAKYTYKQIESQLKTLYPNTDIDSKMWDESVVASVGDHADVTINQVSYTFTVSDAAVKKTLPTLNVIYDQYTTPVGIKVMYYAQPNKFSIIPNIPCELPMDAFDDLVTGAVDLYVQYVAGAEANKRRLQEAQNRQNRKNNEEDED